MRCRFSGCTRQGSRASTSLGRAVNAQECRMPGTRRIAFVASDSPEARAAERELVDRYGYHGLADADTVVALGGDGLMLETLHRVLQMEEHTSELQSHVNLVC